MEATDRGEIDGDRFLLFFVLMAHTHKHTQRENGVIPK